MISRTWKNRAKLLVAGVALVSATVYCYFAVPAKLAQPVSLGIPAVLWDILPKVSAIVVASACLELAAVLILSYVYRRRDLADMRRGHEKPRDYLQTLPGSS